VAGAIAVFMFSLAGLPPLAGFWGKLTLFSSAIEIATSGRSGLAFWFTVLSIAGAINAAIAAAYYLRVIAVMYFQPMSQPPAAEGGRSARSAALVCAGLVVAVGAWPGGLLGVAIQSEAVLRPQTATVQSSPRATAPSLVQASRLP
jgi:NADH-quinone oxidoreductase subunit N